MALKNSLIYIKRKKGSNILLLIIFVAVFVFLQMGSSIYYSADQEIKRLEKTVGNSFVIKSYIDTNDGSLWEEKIYDPVSGEMVPKYNNPEPLNDDLARRFMDIEGITGYNAERRSYLHTAFKVKEGFATMMYNGILNHEDNGFTESDLPEFEIYKNKMAIWGTTDSEKLKQFQNGSLELIKGKHITKDDECKILVSEDFAKRNNLEIGDIVPFDLSEEAIRIVYDSLPGFTPAEYSFRVKGIYRINYSFEPSIGTYEQEMPENYVFVDNNAMQEVEKNFGEDNMHYDYISFYTDQNYELDEVINNARKSKEIGWKYLDLSKDRTNSGAMTEPYRSVGNIGLFFIIASAAGCCIVMFLLMMMRIQSRRAEIGILMSVGVMKKEIIMQFIIEILILLGIAFAISVLISTVLIQPIGNAVNNMINAGSDGEAFKLGYDENLFIDVDAVYYGVDLIYKNENGILLSFILGSAMILLPVILTTKKIMKMNLKDIRSGI